MSNLREHGEPCWIKIFTFLTGRLFISRACLHTHTHPPTLQELPFLAFILRTVLLETQLLLAIKAPDSPARKKCWCNPERHVVQTRSTGQLLSCNRELHPQAIRIYLQTLRWCKMSISQIIRGFLNISIYLAAAIKYAVFPNLLHYKENAVSIHQSVITKGLLINAPTCFVQLTPARKPFFTRCVCLLYYSVHHLLNTVIFFRY